MKDEARKTTRTAARAIALIGVLLAGACTTYLAGHPAALYALPAAVVVVGLVLLVPRSRLSPAGASDNIYSMTAAMFYIILAFLAGGASLATIVAVPALTPPVDLTFRQYRDLRLEIMAHRERAPALAEAARDGRIDLAELAAFHQRIQREEDEAVVRDVVSTARSAH